MTEQSHGLKDVLTHQQSEERERALRALLMQPLLAGGSPELALVRRHAPYLREWFNRETGWVLHVERECARLFKRPASLDDGTRGLPEFDRFRYTLLCLTCAVLERADAQITLAELGRRLLEATHDPELAAHGFVCSLESVRERRALVYVCRFLLAIGVLVFVAGDEEAYIDRSGDALYDVHRRVLAVLPSGTRGASWIAATQPDLDFDGRLRALLAEHMPDTDEGRRTSARHQLARQLLDDPVVYREDLTDFEREYLMSQRGLLVARLAQAVGLKGELRAEGMALIDPDAELTDVRIPDVGTDAHAMLLIAEYLAEKARAESAPLVSMPELAAFVRNAADRYRKYWRKEAREPGAETLLAEIAVDKLQALKLVRRVDGGVQPREALFRYAIGEAEHIVQTEATS
jgi:uncharacterized protein (TIGR02678 family)